MAAMAAHVGAMLELQARGAVVFDYGNNIRAQARQGRRRRRLRDSRLRARVHPPAVLRGQGAVPLGGAVGRSRRHRRHRRRWRSRCSPHDEALCRWIRLARERVAFQGLPARIFWLGYGERARFGLALNELVRARRREGADRHRPRSPRHRIGRLAQPRNRRHARRQRCHRRLADPERAAQHLVRARPGSRCITAAASASDTRCTPGMVIVADGIARGRREAAARADVRSRASAWCATPMPDIPRRSTPRGARALTCPMPRHGGSGR